MLNAFVFYTYFALWNPFKVHVFGSDSLNPLGIQEKKWFSEKYSSFLLDLDLDCEHVAQVLGNLEDINLGYKLIILFLASLAFADCSPYQREVTQHPFNVSKHLSLSAVQQLLLWPAAPFFLAFVLFLFLASVSRSFISAHYRVFWIESSNLCWWCLPFSHADRPFMFPLSFMNHGIKVSTLSWSWDKMCYKLRRTNDMDPSLPLIQPT